MRRLSFILISLTTTFALAQSGNSTGGTSATSATSSLGTSATSGLPSSGISATSGVSDTSGTSASSGSGSVGGSSTSSGSTTGSSLGGGSTSGSSTGGASGMPMAGGSMNGSSMSGGSMSGGSVSGGSTSATATAADRTFVTAAGQGNNFELQAAKIALTNSTNSTVKSYAQKMITDHTKLGAGVKAALTKDKTSLTVPTTVAAGQQATLQKLKGLKGAAFDAAYKNAMVSSHAETYGLFQQYVKAGKLPSLKSAVEQALPIVRMHWDMAKTLPTT